MEEQGTELEEGGGWCGSSEASGSIKCAVCTGEGRTEKKMKPITGGEIEAREFTLQQ